MVRLRDVHAILIKSDTLRRRDQTKGREFELLEVIKCMCTLREDKGYFRNVYADSSQC